MGKTPCSEGIIGINATSVSINAKINKKAGASPFTLLHIFGEENYMTDIPSRSFGSNLAWFCKNNTDLLNLFNKKFPLPNQTSWTVIITSNTVSIKVLESVGINSSYDSLDQFDSQMDSNTIYYFEFQTWNLALQPAYNISKLTIQLL